MKFQLSVLALTLAACGGAPAPADAPDAPTAGDVTGAGSDALSAADPTSDGDSDGDGDASAGGGGVAFSDVKLPANVPQEKFDHALAGQADAIGACFDAHGKGEMMATLLVAPDGAIKSASVAPMSDSNMDRAKCLTDAMEKAMFESIGGDDNATITFHILSE